MRKGGPKTATELAQALKVDEETVEQDIQALADGPYLVKVEEDPCLGYILVDVMPATRPKLIEMLLGLRPFPGVVEIEQFHATQKDKPNCALRGRLLTIRNMVKGRMEVGDNVSETERGFLEMLLRDLEDLDQESAAPKVDWPGIRQLRGETPPVSAVAEGRPHDLADQDILARLLALNQARTVARRRAGCLGHTHHDLEGPWREGWGLSRAYLLCYSWQWAVRVCLSGLLLRRR